MKINFPLSSFLYQGTGSYPLPPQGLHLSMRQRSVLQYRLPCIFRACRNESARGRCIWRDEALVEDYRSCQQPCNRV